MRANKTTIIAPHEAPTKPHEAPTNTYGARSPAAESTACRSLTPTAFQIETAVTTNRYQMPEVARGGSTGPRTRNAGGDSWTPTCGERKGHRDGTGS